MSDISTNEVTETKEVKRGPGRPRKHYIDDRKVTRETRLPKGGFSGPLSMIEENKDPDFRYYWEVDRSEDGSEVEMRIQEGYVFCRPDENLVRGRTSVYSSEHAGSIIRVPAGHGLYHYLMKIPLEWYKDDEKRHNERINELERGLKSNADKKGFYGDISIN